MRSAGVLAALLMVVPAHAQQPPRLAGTVIAPGTRQALLDAGAGTQPVGLDDAIGPWRVQSIEPGLVRLSGPAGTVLVGLEAAAPAMPVEAWRNPCGRLHPRIAGTSRHDPLACRSAPNP